MKKRYEALELEVVRFSNEDVITASVEEPAPEPEPTPAVLIRNPDGPEAIVRLPNGHYAEMNMETGEILQDFGTKTPLG